MAKIRLFAAIRVAAGTGSDSIDGTTVAEIVTNATEKYGDEFATVLPTCRVWVNGQPAENDTPVAAADEVAFLPPVSGG